MFNLKEMRFILKFEYEEMSMKVVSLIVNFIYEVVSVGNIYMV